MATKKPTRHILYLHSNSSCRLAVVRSPLLAAAVGVQAVLVAFDFAGCGVSGGDHVTLGLDERDQVAAVLKRLKADEPAAEFVIWGRSMGAASALLYADKYDDPSIKALVLDSPFRSFRALTDDVLARAAGGAGPTVALARSLRRTPRRAPRGRSVLERRSDPSTRAEGRSVSDRRSGRRAIPRGIPAGRAARAPLRRHLPPLLPAALGEEAHEG